MAQAKDGQEKKAATNDAAGGAKARRGENSESGQDLRLILRAASMYHLDGATHAEIARRLGVSRPTAGRLVSRAHARGLVRVVFDVPADLASSVHPELEGQVEADFDLDEVVVIDENLDGYPAGSVAALGRAAAAVIARRLRAHDTLGFTWGPETVAMADGISGRATTCERIVQLDGALGGANFHTGVDHVFALLTERLGGDAVRLLAPLFADRDTVRAIRKDSRIGQALKIGAEANVMAFGCGTLDKDSTLLEGNFVDPVDVVELQRLKAVGEVAGQYYDIHGREVFPDLRDRTVGVTLDAVRRCPTSVLISGGVEKRDGLLGALRGGLAKVLVTDVDTARWLASHGRKEQA